MVFIIKSADRILTIKYFYYLKKDHKIVNIWSKNN